MPQNASGSIYRNARRWMIVGLFAVLVLYEVASTTVLRAVPRGIWLAVETALLVALGVIVYLSFDAWLNWQEERSRLQQANQKAEAEVRHANQRMQSVLRISQQFAETSEEHEIIQSSLAFCQELVGARAASFVPLDERGQPLPAVGVGEMPFPVTDAWMEYLASPGVRAQCAACQHREEIAHSCPLIGAAPVVASGIYCLPLRRGDLDFGVLNLYLPQPATLDEERRAILRAITDETALALEGLRLRRRELATLRQLQAVREKTDLSGLMTGLLKDFHEALEADYSTLIVVETKDRKGSARLAHGDLPEGNRPLVDGVLNSVLVGSAPVMLGNVAGDGVWPGGVRSLIAAPLSTQDQPALGVLLVASRRSKTYTHRQLVMLQTFAGQVALVVQNANRLAELEYKTILQERKRLAREIHDSFAQTLGFLKLRVAQLRQYVETGDTAQIQKVVPIIHQALSDAYIDVRQTIDGLQVAASPEGLREWLPQITADFSELSGLEVEIQHMPAALDLPDEVQVQLIRIIQEALNNIRKHAQASRVWVDFQVLPGELVCEVRDDGRGFDPEDLPGPSQYGLRGMRERADLISADFQLISRAGSGAVVRLSLPLESLGEAL